MTIHQKGKKNALKYRDICSGKFDTYSLPAKSVSKKISRGKGGVIALLILLLTANFTKHWLVC